MTRYTAIFETEHEARVTYELIMREYDTDNLYDLHHTRMIDCLGTRALARCLIKATDNAYKIVDIVC